MHLLLICRIRNGFIIVKSVRQSEVIQYSASRGIYIRPK